MIRPDIPRPGDPIRASLLEWVMKQVRGRLTGGAGIRVTSYPDGNIVIANTRKRGGGGGALCPKWNFRATSDSVPELQIFNPGTIGGEMPVYDTDSLELVPPPLITVPTAAGVYVVFLKFEWEPDAEIIDGDYYAAQSGTLVEDIKVVVAEQGDPPVNQPATVSALTGEPDNNGIFHLRIGKVERDGASGPLINIVSDHCFSLTYTICNPRVVLGSAS